MRDLVIAVYIFAAVFFGQTANAEPLPEDTLYHYRAIVTDVYDGDTLTVDLDLGFHVWVRVKRSDWHTSMLPN